MITLAQAYELVCREAHLLDARQWDAWLSLYFEDAWFWMPAWRDDTGEPGGCPATELSLIYCPTRAGLEDRVWRLRSGLSVASIVPIRTVHLISSPLLQPAPDVVPGRPDRSQPDAQAAVLRTAFACHLWDTDRRDLRVLCGHWEHHLAQRNGQLGIAGRRIVLASDLIPTMADFYCV
jgi:3-phenylpropionate/cinnamic acid dioxygenase small subunit